MPPKPKPEQGLVGVLAVDQEDHRAAQQAQAVGQHAGDRAGAVAELQGLAEAGSGGGGHAEVAPTARLMPTKPTSQEKRAPRKKAAARPIWTAPVVSAVK